MGSHKLLFGVGGGLWYSLWTSFGTVTQHNCSHGCPKPMHDMRSKQTKHGNCGPESVHKTGTKVNGKRAKCKNSMATAVGIRVGKTFHIHTHTHTPGQCVWDGELEGVHRYPLFLETAGAVFRFCSMSSCPTDSRPTWTYIQDILRYNICRKIRTKIIMYI